MNVRWLASARDDLLAAILYYEQQQVGLGKRLREEVFLLLENIVRDPWRWREREGGYRRANCTIFPYYIAYIIRDKVVVVLAVAHAKRYPNFWKSRRPEEP